MKIKLLSDLHFEFHMDYGDKFLRNLEPDGADVCVLAGDIAQHRLKDKSKPQMIRLLDRFAEIFEHVIFVPGNHDFIGFQHQLYDSMLRVGTKNKSNVHYLNRDVVEIDGIRFVGTTLWYRWVSEAMAKGWIDFDLIPGFYSHYVEENNKNLNFLRDEVQEGDVVITHHLPSHLSVPPKYKNHPQNCFFVCDVEDIIQEKKPALWLHGHTHSGFDYMLGDTRVVCNPRGYPLKNGTMETPEFDPGHIIEFG